MNSVFQAEYGEVMSELMRKYDVALVPELSVDGHRIDLGTDDLRYGVEIKSSLSDLKSGYGLNQDHFLFGYVLCPEQIVCHVIGYLYMRGCDKTGVIVVWRNGKLSLVKPAQMNIAAGDKYGIPYSIFDLIAGSGDAIARMFYEHEGLYEPTK